MLAYVLVTSSFANVLVRANPERAHALAPHDGRITAAYALSDMFSQPDGATEGPPSQLARQALRQDPTAVDALTVLGFAAQLRGDAPSANRAFTYSGRLSRRELRSQLFAIEEAVTRGDIADALRHYDIALRTSSSAPGILFPTLTQAIAEPRVRALLIPILETDPVWTDRFLDFAARTGPNPIATVDLFADMRRAGMDVNEELQGLLVRNLYQRGHYEEAWEYFASIRPGASRERSRDPDFQFDGPQRTPFDWRLGSDRRLAASILTQADGGMLDFMVPPELGGTVVSQEQRLPEGTYRLSGVSSAIDQPERTLPYWTLTCPNGRELGRIPVSSAPQSSSRFRGEFTVPANCANQTLSLIIRPTGDIGGVSGQIDQVQLEPVSSIR